MSTQVPLPVFVDYLSPFAPWCDSVMVDDSWPSTVDNDGSECCLGENTILSDTGDAYATESCDVPILDSGSSTYKSMT